MPTPIPARTCTEMNRFSTKRLLEARGLAPHKRLGQNFLVDENLPLRIVAAAGLSAQERVMEVGVGLGALTRPLAAAVHEVVGIEADSGIIRLHEEQGDLPQNVQLVHADILKVDLASFCRPGERLKIVANLPYAISTPFLFRIMAQRACLHSAVLMLQRELALRLAARPGNKDYGAPTVLLAACADVEPLFAVPPSAFHPRPKVDSLVLRLRFFPEPQRLKALGAFDRPLFTRIVRTAFARRRKTLANALLPLAADRAELCAWLAAADIAATARAETLSLADYVRLCRIMQA